MRAAGGVRADSDRTDEQVTGHFLPGGISCTFAQVTRGLLTWVPCARSMCGVDVTGRPRTS